jgi:hypothetical protein
MEKETGKKLTINCGLACLLNDQEEMLEAYTKVRINCGTLIASPRIYEKLSAKNAQINTGDIRVREIKGTILQLDGGTVIDGGADFKDLFVLSSGSLIATGEGLRALGKAEGVLVLDTFYYPQSGDPSALVKINGKKRVYTDGAQVLLGDQSLERALSSGGKHLWVDGTLSALDAKTLEAAKAAGIRVECECLFTYEGLYAAYDSIFTSKERLLVADGYEISGDLESAKLPLYGSKIYVNGNFTMETKDLPLLEAIEGIVVRGRARLPGSTVQCFRKKGRAADYDVFEGRLVELNGNVHWGKPPARGPEEKLTVRVNGCLRFDDDVTAEDLECIASLSYNGTVLLPPAAAGALAPRVKEANGFMGSLADIEKTTGRAFQDWAADYTGEDATLINTGSYVLI